MNQTDFGSRVTIFRCEHVKILKTSWWIWTWLDWKSCYIIGINTCKISLRCEISVMLLYLPFPPPVSVNVYVPKDRVTNLHQGYGFIEYRSEEDADYVSGAHGLWLNFSKVVSLLIGLHTLVSNSIFFLLLLIKEVFFLWIIFCRQ